VTEIGWYAFEGCSSLEKITIPASVKEIGDNVFEGCTGLKEITLLSYRFEDDLGIIFKGVDLSKVTVRYI
jgi:hypothetical protein